MHSPPPPGFSLGFCFWPGLLFFLLCFGLKELPKFVMLCLRSNTQVLMSLTFLDRAWTAEAWSTRVLSHICFMEGLVLAAAFSSENAQASEGKLRLGLGL